jgi:uncharacterized protein (TIGR00288 family)
METQENQIAVFFDFENIVRGVEDRFGRGAQVSIEHILNRLNVMGRVVIKRAYADFSRFTQYRESLLGNAINCIHMFALKNHDAKNGADIRIAVDVMEVLFAYPNLTHIALISGDSDFTPVVQKVREHGRYVIGIGVKGSVSRYLIQSCNEFIYYDTLIADSSKTETDVRDLEEARTLLRMALEELSRQYTEPPRAGQVKSAMIRLDPSFSEANFGFRRFTDFVRANDDLVELKVNKREGGDIRIALLDSEVPSLTLEKAREFLLEVVAELREQNHAKPSAALLKARLLQRHNEFDEKKLGFKSFAAFLREQKDIIRVNARKP